MDGVTPTDEEPQALIRQTAIRLTALEVRLTIRRMWADLGRNRPCR